MKISLNNFRCFGDEKAVEIRPITFLVGENSSGKTSFLAGLRYLLESFSANTGDAFNRDPYFLGGFQQIAHYRGGRGGRAKAFSLSIEFPGGGAEVRGPRRGRHLPSGHLSPVRHSFNFTKGAPQPQLQSYTFQAGGFVVSFSFDSELPKVTFDNKNKRETFTSTIKRAPPSKVIRENLLYIRFLFRDFLSERSVHSEEGESLPEVERLGLDRDDADALMTLFMNAIENLNQNTFASAPVRTQPLRTYTPSELAASSEGSHVPLELARLKLRSPEQWKSVKESLASFGANSGLFSEIDIRQLGRSDIDPFQILLKIGGPATNLVDVGYGISQVLPIVYQLQNMSTHRTFLLQQPEVHLHPRAQAELGALFCRAIEHSKGTRLIVETHSDYIIDRVRIEVSSKKISHEDVTIIFFRRDAHGSTMHNLFVNSDGDILNAPDDYRSFFFEEHARLLGI